MISSLSGRPPTSYNVFDSSFNSIDQSGNWTVSKITTTTANITELLGISTINGKNFATLVSTVNTLYNSLYNTGAGFYGTIKIIQDLYNSTGVPATVNILSYDDTNGNIFKRITNLQTTLNVVYSYDISSAYRLQSSTSSKLYINLQNAPGFVPRIKYDNGTAIFNDVNDYITYDGLRYYGYIINTAYYNFPFNLNIYIPYRN